MSSVLEQFSARAREMPGRSCVYARGVDVSYGQLLDESISVMSAFARRGLRRGDRVVLLIENSAVYVAAYLGIQAAGGVVVALNPDVTATDLSHYLSDCSPTFVLTERKAAAAVKNAIIEDASPPRVIAVGDGVEIHYECRFDDLVAGASDRLDLPTINPNDIAQIIYTSGTTGKPKGVTLSHGNLVANCDSIVSYLKLTKNDSALVALPFYYSYGNSLLFTHLATGGRLVLADNFVFLNKLLDLMEEQSVTGFSGVPSTYAMLLHKSNLEDRKLLSLRYFTCAGGALAPATVEKIQSLFPHVDLFLMYGQTEATARLSSLMPSESEANPGSIGRGIPNVELRVVDSRGNDTGINEIGEIVARGENVMLGYWNDDDSTSGVLRDGWLWTGDLARRNQNGFIYIVGRRKNIIKCGAYRLNPQEIEQVLMELDAIAEVAVVGLPDPIWGETPVAFVVKSDLDSNIDAAHLMRHCKSRLSRHKMIHGVRFVASLPKTASGKIRHEARLYNCDLASDRS